MSGYFLAQELLKYNFRVLQEEEIDLEPKMMKKLLEMLKQICKICKQPKLV